MFLFEVGDKFNEMHQRSTKAIQFPNDDHITFARGVDHTREFRAIGFGAGRFFAEGFFADDFLAGGFLAGGFLAGDFLTGDFLTGDFLAGVAPPPVLAGVVVAGEPLGFGAGPATPAPAAASQKRSSGAFSSGPAI